MRRKRKSKYIHHSSRHHIIPKSRGGNNSLENIAKINGKNHQLYHHLFSNKTPDEIIKYLVNKYWNNDWSYVDQAYRRRDDK